jgi:hypothetical protein
MQLSRYCIAVFQFWGCGKLGSNSLSVVPERLANIERTTKWLVDNGAYVIQQHSLRRGMTRIMTIEAVIEKIIRITVVVNTKYERVPVQVTNQFIF